MYISIIEEIMCHVGSLSLGAIAGAFIIYRLLKSFLPSYISEKGKNLATKEDIASITNKVESVKTDYAKVIEELRSHNQLKLAEIEREKGIKKEVYLQAVEALTRSHNIISSLANLLTEEKEITSVMTKDAGLLAKIQIVGSESTVKAVTTIMTSIATAILELLLERGALVGRKTEIESLEALRSRLQDEIERYISIMKNLNLEGNQDERLWETINKSIQFETEHRDSFSKKIDELKTIQNKELIEFTKKCMNKFFEIAPHLPDTVLAMREELNLPISRDAYLNIFNQSTEHGKKTFDEFLNKLSSIPT